MAWLRRWRADVLLLAAAVVASACAWTRTADPLNLTLTGLGAVTLVVCLWPGQPVRPPRQHTLVAAVAVCLAPLIVRPPTANVVVTPLFWVSVGSEIAALVLATLPVWLPRLGRLRVRVAAFGLAAAGIVLAVPGGQRPHIDVWVLLRDAALGVAHGRNPYLARFPDVPKGQTSSCFTYLPGSFLLGWPGQAVGDVRYAEAVGFVAGWAVLALVLTRHTSTDSAARGRLWLLLTLGVALPGGLRVAQQAWLDGLVVGLLLMFAAAELAGRRYLALVPLALAGATKQHVALLAPLLVVWLGWRRALLAGAGAVAVALPWLLASPGRMWQCDVQFFLHLPATHDSISLWRFLPGPVRTPLVAASVLAALVLAINRLPRTMPGWLLGAAAVMAGLNLANKQSYENQWWLAAELALAAVAVWTAGPTWPAVPASRVDADGAPPGRPDRVTAVQTGRDVGADPDRRDLLRVGLAGLTGLAGLGGLVAGAGCSVLSGSNAPAPAPSTAGPPASAGNTLTPSPTPTPPLVPADAALVGAALANLHAAGVAATQAGVVQPAVRPAVRPLLRAQRVQVGALAQLAEIPAPAAPTPTPTPTQTPTQTPGPTTARSGRTKPTGKPKRPRRPSPAQVYQSLATREDALTTSLKAHARAAESSDLAVLLASSAASAASWQRSLQARGA